MTNTSIVIFSDGGSRGNPGPAASAFAIFQDEKLITTGAKYLGQTTNNVAEYNGVILALEHLVTSDISKACAFGIGTSVLFKMDSELVVKQLTGVYKIKDANLMDLAMKVKQLIKENNLNIQFTHVPRAENALADKLVNEKLDDSSRQ